MSEFDQHLADQLRRRASGFEIPAGDTGAVMARGRARQHRRRATAAVAVVAAGATATAVGVAVHSPAQRATKVLSQNPTPSTSVPSSSADELSWQVAPASAGLYMATSLTGAGSTQYAVSTGPGFVATYTSVPTPYLYRSTDGASWSVASMANGSNSLADVSASGGTIYSVGTEAASAYTGTGAEGVSVESSTDGGSTFQIHQLPLDFSAPNGSLSAGPNVLRVAAGPKGVVATVGAALQLDVTKLIPSAPAASGWEATPNGVELLGTENPSACGAGSSLSQPTYTGLGTAAQSAAAKRKAGLSGATTYTPSSPASGSTTSGPPAQIQTVTCFDSGSSGGSPNTRQIPADQAYVVVGSYTWAQTGVSAQAAAELEGQAIVFYSADGKTFQPVSLPESLQNVGLQLAAGPDGFAVASYVNPESQNSIVLTSVDGQQWTSGPPLPGSSDMIDGMGYLAGHLVVIGQGDTGNSSAAYTLAGSGWTTASVPCQADGGVSFGPLGVAAVGVDSTGSDPSWNVCFSPDGSNWSSKSLTTLAGGQIDEATVVVTSDRVVVTVTRPPATSTPATPASEVAVVGTLAGS